MPVTGLNRPNTGKEDDDDDFISDFFFNCHFKLFGENHMKIIITGQIFLSNYELSRFSK
jgi:hypothetical protein